jgi:hypothetical protein
MKLLVGGEKGSEQAKAGLEEIKGDELEEEEVKRGAVAVSSASGLPQLSEWLSVSLQTHFKESLQLNQKLLQTHSKIIEDILKWDEHLVAQDKLRLEQAAQMVYFQQFLKAFIAVGCLLLLRALLL